MSIVTVCVIALGSATFGFLAAALLSGAKGSNPAPTREPVRDTRVFSGPSPN